MHFWKYFGLLTVTLASPAVAEYTFEQGVSDIQLMTSSIYKGRKALEAYDGGILGGMQLVSHIVTGYNHATATQENIRPFRNFTQDDAAEATVHVQDMMEAMTEGLGEAREKAPVIKQSGFGFVARAMVLTMENEKNNFLELMQSKADDEMYRSCEPHLNRLDKNFKALMADLQD